MNLLSTAASLFFPNLTTTPIDEGRFPHECILAGISIFFCRYTAKSPSDWSILPRLFFASALALLAYRREPYDIIFSLYAFSYLAPELRSVIKKRSDRKGQTADLVSLVTSFLICGASSVLACKFLLFSPPFHDLVGSHLIPEFTKKILYYLFPIDEIRQAYGIVSKFMGPDELNERLGHLLFITFNVQVGMGYLGISFLTMEQSRKNQLVRIDREEDRDDSNGDANDETSRAKDDSERPKRMERARRFWKGAAPFIVFGAFPYMVQIIVLGNFNEYSFSCFRDEVHRAVRLKELFDHDTHLVALAEDSAKSPGAFASSIDEVVQTTYDIFNRKLFSLPKLLLLPGIIVKQPTLLVQIFPIIMISDFIKGRIVATMNSNVERLKKETVELEAIRTKIEQYDMKNAELLQQSGYGSTQFTKRKWAEITERIQDKNVLSKLLRRTRGYFAWLQRNFVMIVLVDCALAKLLAMGRIMSSEIFVFSRAIEDAVDTLLMKSRAEAELASMMTEIDKLNHLVSVWDKSKDRKFLACHLEEENIKLDYNENTPSSTILSIQNLNYSRGTANVRVEKLNLSPGIYAVTGHNGSGKSTLFRVLMSCQSNKKSIDLPVSIVISNPNTSSLIEAEMQSVELSSTGDQSPEIPSKINATESKDEYSILMPSSHVVEISQSFYWPLYTKPIDWMYQTHVSEMKQEQRDELVMRVTDLLTSLLFSNAQDGASSSLTLSVTSQTQDITSDLMKNLLEEKEDWFQDLSGGQKSKVELVRKVFLAETCPDVLLIDETMAPLDPKSKSLVMSKIKKFCASSVVLVIYHSDVKSSSSGNGDGDGGNNTDQEEENDDPDFSQHCVPSSNFFDENLHFENEMITRRSVC